MRGTRRFSKYCGSLTLGLACVAGCHQIEPAPAPPRGPSTSLLGAMAPSEPVTKTQIADMQVAMGRTAEQEGDLKRAVTAYTAALKRDQGRADANLRLAIVLDRQGKFRESADHYEKALRNAPGNPDIFCDMGYSLYLQRRWAEAEMNLKQAIALRPDHRRAHNNLGLLLAHNGREEEALKEFRLAGNEPAQAHNNLAFVLTTDRKWERARKQYQLALAADPKSEQARTRLHELDTLVARLDPRPPVAPLDPRPPVAKGLDSRVVATSAAGPRVPAPPAPTTAAPRPAADRGVSFPPLPPDSGDLFSSMPSPARTR